MASPSCRARPPWRSSPVSPRSRSRPIALGFSIYTKNLVTLAFLMISGALAWNWMGGFVGQVSFGHAALFGVGGFVAARLMLMEPPAPAPLAWLAGGLAAGVFSLGAHPMLRLRGPYFSIATIGVGEASRLIFTYWEDFTGGVVRALAPDRRRHEGPALLVGARARRARRRRLLLIRRSTLGLQLLAIKADVEAAADVGVNATFYQDLVFALSGAVVGVTGGLYASYFSFIEPGDMFGFDRSIAFVLMSVIGGVGTVLGPVLGAIVFVLLRQFLLASYPQLYLGLYGVLLIFIILFEPLGLTGLALRLRALRAAAAPGRAARVARLIPPCPRSSRTHAISKSFGGLKAVDGVTIELLEGEILGVIGPNGAGKTTLFSLIAGSLRPDLRRGPAGGVARQRPPRPPRRARRASSARTRSCGRSRTSPWRRTSRSAPSTGAAARRARRGSAPRRSSSSWASQSAPASSRARSRSRAASGSSSRARSPRRRGCSCSTRSSPA